MILRQVIQTNFIKKIIILIISYGEKEDIGIPNTGLEYGYFRKEGIISNAAVVISFTTSASQSVPAVESAGDSFRITST